uniref:Uncharacterized protein n=1 Tax=Plectus sambesii TaxID=2011161 RepID=A0A914W473_9BILA
MDAGKVVDSVAREIYERGWAVNQAVEVGEPGESAPVVQSRIVISHRANDAINFGTAAVDQFMWEAAPADDQRNTIAVRGAFDLKCGRFASHAAVPARQHSAAVFGRERSLVQSPLSNTLLPEQFTVLLHQTPSCAHSFELLCLVCAFYSLVTTHCPASLQGISESFVGRKLIAQCCDRTLPFSAASTTEWLRPEIQLDCGQTDVLPPLSAYHLRS